MDVEYPFNVTGHIIIKPPLKDFWTPDFSIGFYYSKKSWHFFSGSYYSTKISACGGLLLLYFSQKAKFGLSGGRFFNKTRVFALKYP